MGAFCGVLNIDGQTVDNCRLTDLRRAFGRYAAGRIASWSRDVVGVVCSAEHIPSERHQEKQQTPVEVSPLVLWNGRLDNRDELLQELSNDLAGECRDQAIIRVLYRKWGSNAFSKIIGDWALALWDQNEKTLHLAVDYVGMRHLYFSLVSSHINWSTHLSPMVVAHGSPLELSDEYIAGLLAFFPEPNLTPFKDIRAVGPGEHVIVRDGQITTRTYWNCDSLRPIRHGKDAEYEEQFRHLFRQSIRRRLTHDYPVIAELSGGLDSSSIVCMAADLLTSGVASTPRLDMVTYYSQREPGGDERPYVAKIEQKVGRSSSYINVDADEDFFRDHFADFEPTPVWHSSHSHAAAAFKAIASSQGYRAVLSGVGGDELLGGIPNPRPLLADLLEKCNFSELFQQAIKWSMVKRIPVVQLLAESAVLLLPNRLQTLFSSTASTSPWIGKRLAERYNIGKMQMGLVDGCRNRIPSFREGVQSLWGLRRQLAANVETRDGLLEYRYPYLDQDLVEFLISIPMTQLLRPGERRSLMRRALRGIVPTDILSRKSKSFTAHRPLSAVERQWPVLVKALADPLSAEAGYLDKGRFLIALTATRNGKYTKDWMRLFRAIHLEFWLKDMVRRRLIDVRGSWPPHESSMRNAGIQCGTGLQKA